MRQGIPREAEQPEDGGFLIPGKVSDFGSWPRAWAVTPLLFLSSS